MEMSAVNQCQTMRKTQRKQCQKWTDISQSWQQDLDDSKLGLTFICLYYICCTSLHCCVRFLVAAAVATPQGAVLGLPFLQLQALWSMCKVSVVVVHGLSCPTACGILPDQVLNPRPYKLLTTRPPGKFPAFDLFL